MAMKITTAICKQFIVDFLSESDCDGIFQAMEALDDCSTLDEEKCLDVKNWKRESKRKDGESTLRLFSYKLIDGITAFVRTNKEDTVSIDVGMGDGSPMQYRFWVSSDNEDFEDDCGDFQIFVMDQNDCDNIGGHTPAVAAVMNPLGIFGEDMENLFSGSYSEKIKTNQDVIDYLKSAGWLEDENLSEGF